MPQRVTRRTFHLSRNHMMIPCLLVPSGKWGGAGQVPVRDGTASRVRRDSSNDDLTPLGPVVPEDPVGRWRLTLCVGCKHLFALQTLQAFVFVGIETRMVQVGFHEAEGLSYRLQAFLKTLVSLKRL